MGARSCIMKFFVRPLLQVSVTWLFFSFLATLQKLKPTLCYQLAPTELKTKFYYNYGGWEEDLVLWNFLSDHSFRYLSPDCFSAFWPRSKNWNQLCVTKLLQLSWKQNFIIIMGDGRKILSYKIFCQTTPSGTLLLGVTCNHNIKYLKEWSDKKFYKTISSSLAPYCTSKFIFSSFWATW